MTKAMYKTNPIRDGRTCDLVKAFCKTNPIFIGRHCWESSYLCHSWRGRSLRPLCLCGGIAVLQNEANFGEADAWNPHCKTNPIFAGRPCWKSSYHCHSGVAVLCVLCVSVVELPFCKTKPISGKPMPGTRIAKRTQFSSEGVAGKAVISVILAWPFSASSVSLW
jgi:hypothetical protein